MRVLTERGVGAVTCNEVIPDIDRAIKFASGAAKARLQELRDYLAEFPGSTPVGMATMGRVQRALEACAAAPALPARYGVRSPGRRWAAQMDPIPAARRASYSQWDYPDSSIGLPQPGPSGFRANPYEVRGTLQRQIPPERSLVPQDGGYTARYGVQTLPYGKYRDDPHDTARVMRYNALQRVIQDEIRAGRTGGSRYQEANLESDYLMGTMSGPEWQRTTTAKETQRYKYLHGLRR